MQPNNLHAMTPLLKEAYSPEAFRKAGHELVDMLADYLSAAQDNKPGSFFEMQEPRILSAQWDDYLNTTEKSGRSFFKNVLAGSLNLQHPRYMGHQVAVPLPVTALSSMLSNIINNGMAVYEVGNAASVIEKKVTDLLCRVLGYNKEAGGLLTSGGTLANLTALLTARACVTGQAVWETGQEQPFAVMVSEEAHYCVDRAVRVMGWGSKGIIKIPVDSQYRMRTDLLPEYFAKAQREGIRVIAVIGSACSTSAGAYDDLEAIGAFCRTQQLWFHADGAHGSAVAFSEKYKHLIKGIEQADSVVTDFHKLLMTPALATAVVYKNGLNAYKTFRQDAQYLWNDASHTDHYQFGKKTFECTKLMMGVKIYSIIHQYGTKIFEDYIDTVHDHAQLFAQKVNERPLLQLAVPPQSNIVCFRYQPEPIDEEQLNRYNQAIRVAILREGNFYIVQTTFAGNIYLRVSLMNPFTSEADMDALLDEVERIGKGQPE
jgi:L-2,4-diaminobutyrate decarboxylase